MVRARCGAMPMGTIRMFIGVSVIAASVFVGAKLVPPYFDNYEFEDAIKNEATLDAYSSKTEADIRAVVFRRAQELEIPISQESIHVQRQGVQGSAWISIRAPYVVHVDLPGYPLDLHFEAATENRGVL
jgi:hypothetical protein